MVKAGTLEASRPTTHDGNRVFEVATLRLDFCANECTFVSERTEDKATGYWVRPLPRQLMVDQVPGVDRLLTPRCALDDRKRLYFRARDWTGVTAVLSDLVRNQHATRPSNPDPQQAVAMGFVVIRNTPYRVSGGYEDRIELRRQDRWRGRYARSDV